MSVSKAQKMAQQKYNQKAYDQVLIRVKKGKREEYRLAAEARGVGLMEMFRLGVEEYIQNHEPCYNAETIQAIEEAERGEGLSRTFTTVDELMEDLMSDA